MHNTKSAFPGRRAFLATAAVLASIVAVPVVAPNLGAAPALAKSSVPSMVEHQARLKSVATADGTVRYLDLGPTDGAAIMLLHGIPTSSYLYRDVAARLAERGYRVLAPDQLGMGASDKPSGQGIYGADRHAKRMLAVADAAGVESFVPVLHDVGGMVGWEMVMAKPDRLAGLVALNTMIDLNGVRPAAMVMEIMGGQKTPDQVFGDLSDPAVARASTKQWLDQGWVDGAAPDALVDTYAKDLEGGAAAYVSFMTEAVPRFMGTGEQRVAALEDFDKPTAIVFGTQDRYFDHTVVVPALKSALGTPDANVTLVPEAGHFVPEHAPDKVVEAIDAFMKTLAAD